MTSTKGEPIGYAPYAITGGGPKCTIPRPAFGQVPTLLEQIAAPVGGLDLVADSMGQRHLGNFERETGALGSPIAQARPETMHRQLTALHAAQQDQHRHIAERLPGFPTREDEIAAAALAQFLKIAIDAFEPSSACARRDPVTVLKVPRARTEPFPNAPESGREIEFVTVTAGFGLS